MDTMIFGDMMLYMDMMIFGMPAFEQYYMIHDNERNQLGIAPMKNNKKLTTGELRREVPAGNIG